MTYRRIRFGRSSAIILFATTVFCLHPGSIAAQDLEAKPASTNQDSTANSLPDAALPAGQPEGQAQDAATPSSTQTNQLALLPATLTRTPLTGEDKLRIYIHKAFGPPAVILPALGTSYQMANPPNHYPRDWKDGAGAFGRIYGYKVADRTSRDTAQFLTSLLLHEDPRYQRSMSTNALRRTLHALAFTVVDKTDSGGNTFAASNFASAAAGGFVGMGILPNGYNDLTHAEQRMASEFLQIAIGNIATEFEPQWGPWAKKIRLPKILPAWWVPRHPGQP
jgi:hypothetical protein